MPWGDPIFFVWPVSPAVGAAFLYGSQENRPGLFYVALDVKPSLAQMPKDGGGLNQSKKHHGGDSRIKRGIDLPDCLAAPDNLSDFG